MFTSMASNQVPGSVRIRTDEGNEWRYDAIEKAARYYGCNRSDAVGYACEDIAQHVNAARAVLERDDLTIQQRREIADTLSTRGVTFEIDESLTVTTKGDG